MGVFFGGPLGVLTMAHLGFMATLLPAQNHSGGRGKVTGAIETRLRDVEKHHRV